MRKIFSLFVFALVCIASMSTSAQQARKPKLVLGIMVDQFRYDYSTRFQSEYSSGIARLLNEGAVFVDAHQDHFPTVTAVGHTTFLTGSVPSTSGIIANSWFDRATGHDVTSVQDDATHLVGTTDSKPGSSPHRLIVSSLGDELKNAMHSDAKVIGISMKDRAAILTVGRSADAAYWFDAESGRMVTSSWYMDSLPSWVVAFNQKGLAFAAQSSAWLPISAHKQDMPFVTLGSASDKNYISQWMGTPFANDMLESFAETTLNEEHLGQHEGTDLLTVSFSANDRLGHALGPDSAAVEEMCLQTDQAIGRLIDAAVKAAGGRENLLVVWSSDHGVAPLPEVNRERKMPGERVNAKELYNHLNAELAKVYGDGKWIESIQEVGVYLNQQLIQDKHLDIKQVEATASAAALALPYIARTYTRTQLLEHRPSQDLIDDYIARSFYAPRSPDLVLVATPYTIFSGHGAEHGSPYNYDTHVPLIFWGGAINPGHHLERVGISDIAPTLAAVLQINTPSGNIGHILPQIAQPYLSTPTVLQK